MVLTEDDLKAVTDCEGCRYCKYEKETDAEVCTAPGKCINDYGYSNNTTED